ncbi:MAG TPA: Hsp20/alpha crystallin family protein [Blastocatellia bacterium]|jgi:HSP20 family protein|nr:Hsp20/alpha crystallin family protein [Blastocatellia bacterium]
MAGIKGEKQSQGDQSTAMRHQHGDLAQRGDRTPDHFPLSAREFFSSGPLEMIRRFSEEMDHAVGHMFENLGLSRGRGFGELLAWAPAIEVFERDNKMIVRAELPGMSKDDIKVEMTDEGLLIHGERKREKEEECEGWYRSERSYGEFRRLIPLPEGVNADQAKARFENGVLEVTAPIPESARRQRSVPIEIGGEQAAKTAAGGSSKR